MFTLISFHVFLFCQQFTVESFNVLSWWYNNVSSLTRVLGSLASYRKLSKNYCKVPCCHDGPASTDGSKENGMSIIGNLPRFPLIACFVPKKVSFSITMSNDIVFFPVSQTWCHYMSSLIIAPMWVTTLMSTSFIHGSAWIVTTIYPWLGSMVGSNSTVDWSADSKSGVGSKYDSTMWSDSALSIGSVLGT